MQNAKNVHYSLLFLSGKKAILSDEWCVCFDSDCEHKALKADFGVRFFVTGACQNTKANFSLLPIYNRQIVCGSYFGA